MPTTESVDDVMSELAELADPKTLAVNERHGDHHAVKLTAVRAIAKRLGKHHELARELWATGDEAARLVALLICRPAEFTADELDTMMRETRRPKLQDWLTGYVVGKGPHRQVLRSAWVTDPDPLVASAGWALTADQVAKRGGDLNLPALLDEIEADMAQAPERLQWQMNTCLAQIGIQDADLRERAVDIGERLGVLKDYPTSPGCTSPYAPAWIAEMVRRAGS